MVLDLAPSVVERLQAELGAPAVKILSCLRTAKAFLTQAETDESGLRLSASAAYNVREALNHVVEGHDPAEGGLTAVLTAWRVYETQTAVPGTDQEAAREALDSILRRVSSGESRATSYSLKLLAKLRSRAGIDPRSGPADLIAEYQELRGIANDGVHEELSLAEVNELFDRVVTWFGRMFIPPDEVADAILELAAQPWSSADQVEALASIATNDHHLRLFFGAVQDPAWLTPLHAARIAQAPSTSSAWPVAALRGGLGQTAPAQVAELLQLIMTDIATMESEVQAAARFEVLRVAVSLGAEGYPVMAEIARLHSDSPNIRSFVVHATCDAEPYEPVVGQVADAVLNHCSDFSSGTRYDATEILVHLVAGVTDDNLVERARMIAGKTRRLARGDKAGHVWLGVQALGLDLDDHPQPLLLFAHHLSRLISAAQKSDVPFREQWNWVRKLSGEVGDRLRGQVLAHADTQPISDGIAHIAQRITHALTTAEDLALVASIMAREPSAEDLRPWVEACGTPSPSPVDEDDIPADWRRMWRWAALLPDSVLTAWADAITRTSELWNDQPTTQPLIADRNFAIEFQVVESPYGIDDLSGRPPLEVAAMVASWNLGEPSNHGWGDSFPLARALEEAVAADPGQWSATPQAIMSALGTNQYVEHYVRGLTAGAADIGPNAPQVIDAVVARMLEIFEDADQPYGFNDGKDTQELQKVLLDLVRGLANHEGDISARVNEMWDVCERLIHSAPEGGKVGSSPLERAINSSWGQGLQTMLALAGWEHRNTGSVRIEFTQALNNLLGLPDGAGLEFRAILASSRAFLENIAGEWLEACLQSFFRRDPFGKQTFDLTLKWAHPTPWLYRHCADDLFEAARRHADNVARIIAIATVHEVSGYDLDTLLRRLKNVPDVLADTAEDIAYLVQGAEPDSLKLAAAVKFWTRLLGGDTTTVQIALARLGRWSFVNNIDDDQWLQLTARTLEATGGRINYPMSVADRLVRAQATEVSCRVFIQLLDNTDQWERQHIAAKATDMLRASPEQLADHAFSDLRARLIDLGFFGARIISPSNGAPG
ncbi:hypothetical protein AB0M22_34530 [Nocardia sp. NPDC051756]|uniref:hypothetical protein n=1 Tax=Nocardia sp. NPDC051756 TaxID=3154751 RepID=UPI00342659DC